MVVLVIPPTKRGPLSTVDWSLAVAFNDGTRLVARMWPQGGVVRVSHDESGKFAKRLTIKLRLLHEDPEVQIRILEREVRECSTLSDLSQFLSRRMAR